jgi:galactose mutarotase-like enzyme
MVIIEDGSIKVSIHNKGAELQSLYNKANRTEYMWNGDPAFWGKHSPVLFPIVGTLKNDTYYYKNKTYTLFRHGFARDKEFMVSGISSNAVTFTLTSDDTTLVVFPFPFQFDVAYLLQNNSLKVTYRVKNTGSSIMYFSVGGHPAFRVPLAYENRYDDYILEFNETEDAPRWLISPEGLIEKKTVPLLSHTEQLTLTKELFYQDAIVLKQLKSNMVRLFSETSDPGLLFDFSGFPYLGIWAAKNADFVCIEPWCGLADTIDSNQQLSEKEGINSLEAGESFERSWTVKVF